MSFNHESTLQLHMFVRRVCGLRLGEKRFSRPLIKMKVGVFLCTYKNINSLNILSVVQATKGLNIERSYFSAAF